MKSTYNFKVWNQYCDDSELAVSEFLENIEKPTTPKMTIY
jgi:hypothetical protein